MNVICSHSLLQDLNIQLCEEKKEILTSVEGGGKRLELLVEDINCVNRHVTKRFAKYQNPPTLEELLKN